MAIITGFYLSFIVSGFILYVFIQWAEQIEDEIIEHNLDELSSQLEINENVTLQRIEKLIDALMIIAFISLGFFLLGYGLTLIFNTIIHG